MAYLYSFKIMYKSQFHKIDPYDWFCVLRSHMCKQHINCKYIYCIYYIIVDVVPETDFYEKLVK